WIFCPTRAALEQCEREDLGDEAHYVGDVMNDTLRLARDLPTSGGDVLDRFGVTPGDYVVATIHRPENTASAALLVRVLDYIRDEARGAPIIFPTHPRVAAVIAANGLDMSHYR